MGTRLALVESPTPAQALSSALHLGVPTLLATGVAELQELEDHGTPITDWDIATYVEETFWENSASRGVLDWTPLITAARGDFGPDWRDLTRDRIFRSILPAFGIPPGKPIPLVHLYDSANRRNEDLISGLIELVIAEINVWWAHELSVAWLRADGWAVDDARKVLGPVAPGGPVVVAGAPWVELQFMCERLGYGRDEALGLLGDEARRWPERFWPLIGNRRSTKRRLACA
jgi:hypothetical protein